MGDAKEAPGIVVSFSPEVMQLLAEIRDCLQPRISLWEAMVAERAEEEAAYRLEVG